MKKMILAALLLTSPMMMTSMSSCGVMQGSTGNSLGSSIQTISKVANIASTAKEIANILGINLGLKDNQTSSLTNIFSNYIGQTNGIASLATSNIGSYAKKLTSINKGTLGKINKILTVAQYAKLLGLAGNNSSQKSLIDGLKGGSSLSGSAVNVLSGLLLNGIK